jgi:hypothetical protein
MSDRARKRRKIKLSPDQKDLKLADELRRDVRAQLEELRAILFPDEEEELYASPGDDDEEDDNESEYAESGDEQDEDDEQPLPRRREPTVRKGMMRLNRLYKQLTELFLSFEDGALRVLDEPVGVSEEYDPANILAALPHVEEE